MTTLAKVGDSPNRMANKTAAMTYFTTAPSSGSGGEPGVIKDSNAELLSAQ